MALRGHIQWGPAGLRLEDGFGRTPPMGACRVEARRWLWEYTSDGGLLCSSYNLLQKVVNAKYSPMLNYMNNNPAIYFAQIALHGRGCVFSIDFYLN